MGKVQIMVGLAVKFDVSAYLRFMAKLTYRFYRDLVYRGNILIHQVIRTGEGLGSGLSAHPSPVGKPPGGEDPWHGKTDDPERNSAQRRATGEAADTQPDPREAEGRTSGVVFTLAARMTPPRAGVDTRHEREGAAYRRLQPGKH